MHCYTAGLGSSPFARRYWGNRCYFLFLQVLRCFSSLRSPPENLRMRGSLPPGCPIRTSAGLCAFAARRSFSQLVTSFFASESPGIPHAPLVVPLFLHRTELSSIMLFAIDLLDCETSVVFLLLSLAGSNCSDPRFQYVIVLFQVENNGFEPLTPCLQNRCSSQLS